MEHQKKSLILGTILIIIGLLYLGTNLELWKFNLFFPGWWTLFIIVPSVISLIQKENTISSVLGIIIGVLLFLAVRDYIEWIMVGKVFLPFVIISIGVSLIFKPKLNHPKKNKKGIHEYIGIFSGREENINDIFEGASCVAVFGGVELDLTEAKITEDVVINCVAVFGGIDIKLPTNVVLKSDGISIFGGASNKYQGSNKGKQITVFINHVSIFGGTEIK